MIDEALRKQALGVVARARRRSCPARQARVRAHDDGRIGPRVRVGGPWFEDFAVGQVFDDAPGLTLGAGHAALHQAIAGDRLRLALDEPLVAS